MSKQNIDQHLYVHECIEIYLKNMHGHIYIKANIIECNIINVCILHKHKVNTL